MKAPRESDLLRACLDLLRIRGIYAWRVNTTGVFDPTRKRFRSFHGLEGVSDVLGILPPHGRLLAVETKSASGRLTAEQRHFLDTVGAAGGVALVVRDVTELAALLDGLQTAGDTTTDVLTPEPLPGDDRPCEPMPPAKG